MPTITKPIILDETGQDISSKLTGIKTALDNINLNIDISDKVDWKSAGILGAKNLNSYPYYHSSRTLNNVVWTVNADGSVNANGQASGGNSNFACHSRIETNINALILPNGKYFLSGCPEGGSDSTFYFKIERTTGGSAVVIATDYGEGVEFTLNGDDNYNDRVVLQVICTIRTNYNAQNLLFKPMIRLIEDTDATFRPYAMTNKQMTDILNNVPATAGTYTLQATRNADNSITYAWS